MKSNRTTGRSKVHKKPGLVRSRKLLHIPPILLEGDTPAIPLPASRMQPAAFSPEPSVPESKIESVQEPLPFRAWHKPEELPPAVPELPKALPDISKSVPKGTAPVASLVSADVLPEAYGTGRLSLTPRDPNWIYAHWDLTREQLKEYNRRSAEGHLILRVFTENAQGQVFNEIHVHPESRNWFVHVSQPGTKFSTELGYFSREGRQWTVISKAGPVSTPSGALSTELTAEFQTLRSDSPFMHLVRLARETLESKHLPLEGVGDWQPEHGGRLPEHRIPAWAQERSHGGALIQLIEYDESRRVSMGSFEASEAWQRQLRREIFPGAVTQPGNPELSSAGPTGISSQSLIGEQEERRFWFNVNAELVVYGATDPNARVDLGGRTIQLRPDGTFSFRFALPDGNFILPTVAISADNKERRSATLHFSRQTEYVGEVMSHPQPAELKPPLAENVS